MKLTRLGCCALFVLTVITGLVGLSADFPQNPKNDPEVTKLLVQQRDFLQGLLKIQLAQFSSGRTEAESLLKVARDVLENKLELATSKAERIEAHTDFFKVICEWDNREVGRVESGLSSRMDHLAIRSERLKAEIALRRVGGKPPPGIIPARSPAEAKVKE